MTEKPQNITINRRSTSTGPVSTTPEDLSASGRERYPHPRERPLSPHKDGYNFGITFHYQYFRPCGRSDQVYASVSKRLWRGRRLDRQWTQRGGHQILQAFPPSGAINMAPLYYQYWPIFDGWYDSGKKRG